MKVATQESVGFNSAKVQDLFENEQIYFSTVFV